MDIEASGQQMRAERAVRPKRGQQRAWSGVRSVQAVVFVGEGSGEVTVPARSQSVSVNKKALPTKKRRRAEQKSLRPSHSLRWC